VKPVGGAVVIDIGADRAQRRPQDDGEMLPEGLELAQSGSDERKKNFFGDDPSRLLALNPLSVPPALQPPDSDHCFLELK
jgi:hypothetical protein